jgi:hypothetical protein
MLRSASPLPEAVWPKSAQTRMSNGSRENWEQIFRGSPATTSWKALHGRISVSIAGRNRSVVRRTVRFGQHSDGR